ncbi:MAG TPA: tetratricopeptide repeat protein [Patescibacteria group bacterium]|nr:tetratricopeptide repeat protein [Patescibacteria group bacterium]
MTEQGSSKAVVNGKPVSTTVKKTPTKLILGLVVLVVVAAVSFGVYWHWFRAKPKIQPLAAIPTLNPANAADSQKLINNATKTDISHYSDTQKSSYYYNLASIYSSKGDDANALINLKLALATSPNDAGILESTGATLHKLGQNADAKSYYQMALVQYQKMDINYPGISDKISEIQGIIQGL